ncbi:unnamed protein product [Rotaria socialis]|uniref:Dynein heavy chain coiled coil stalk domain-containing protein n=2 Tax=Rotaria socialis TaxID=392032 RepID=A0A817SR88_9BILA|nr:unnamed protein product [Rotaria socialis]
MASTIINKNTVPISLAMIEESLRQIPSTDFQELKSSAKPPLCCLAVLEGVGILLNPAKQQWEWTDDKNLMSGSKHEFLQRLFDFNKDNINNKQLERLKSILDRTDCQPADIAKISRLCSELCIWLGAILEYSNQRQISN